MRLLSLALISLLLVGGAYADDPSAQSSSPADEWSQFRGNLLRTGRSASPLPDQLELLWTYEAGFSIDSSAAIVDGKVYLTALPGHIAALNLEDGTVVWKRDFGEDNDLFGESSPTLAICWVCCMLSMRKTAKRYGHLKPRRRSNHQRW